ASSRSPSPITTVPSMLSASKARRIASTAAWSDSFLLPRPISRAAAIAAISVTLTTSRARLRSILILLSFVQCLAIPLGSRSALEQPGKSVGNADRLPAPTYAGVHGAACTKHPVFLFPHQLVLEG